jgi:hypothetical protein
LTRVSSIFSQILQLIPRLEFESAVRQHQAERHARGFSRWGQFIAMLFCQLGHAKPCGKSVEDSGLPKENFVTWVCPQLHLAPPWPTPMNIGLGSCNRRFLSNC